MKEFDEIINRHKRITPKGHVVYDGFQGVERSRLEEIYKLMSRDQQEKSVVVFLPRPKPWPKIVPTANQLEEFSNPKNYGVWVDHKKISNEALKTYKSTDFSHVFISRLYGTARSNVNYNFQVDLMTNNFYNDYLESEKKTTGYMMMIKWPVIVKASDSNQ